MKLQGQKLIDEIYSRAQKTNFGCGEPEQSLVVKEACMGEGADAKAMTLINAFHNKYDLISILQATLEILEESQNGVDKT